MAQGDHLLCRQSEATHELRQNHPDWVPLQDHAQAYLEEFTRNFSESRNNNQEIYIVPVVFHVIHNNGPENISDEQILDALNILNRDYRKNNADTVLIVGSFQSIASDIGIEFRLATRDPQGNCTRGINRVVSTLTSTGDDSVKDLIHWPRNQYLNIYICAAAAGAAGYAYLPGMVDNSFSENLDGIVIQASYVGSIGSGNPTTSRALTHEVGHWLNLYHTWGDSNSPADPNNCGMTDYVDDTPPTIGWQTCNLSGASCGSTFDNVQNYMEYSYCSKMFTEGQRLRMRAALNSGVAERSSIITASNQIATGVINPPLCLVDFSTSNPVICVGQSVSFQDDSYHNINHWHWNFGDGASIAGNVATVHQNPAHQYDQPGVYNVSLVAGNEQDSLVATKNNFIVVLDSGAINAPLIEGFENGFPGNNWYIFNQDGGITWEVTPSAYYSGAKSLRLRNVTNQLTNNVDNFTTTTFDMSGMDTIFISYRWAYANKTTPAGDRFRVAVTGSCGEIWTTKRLRNGNTNLPTANATNVFFTPADANDWSSETLVMTDSFLMNKNFRVRFEFAGYGGNNFFLDDINIIAKDSLSTYIFDTQGANPLVIYPNPSEANMILRLSNKESQRGRIALYNVLGQEVLRVFEGMIPAGEVSYNVAHCAAGSYQLVVLTDKSKYATPIIFK